MVRSRSPAGRLPGDPRRVTDATISRARVKSVARPARLIENSSAKSSVTSCAYAVQPMCCSSAAKKTSETSDSGHPAPRARFTATMAVRAASPIGRPMPRSAPAGNPTSISPVAPARRALSTARADVGFTMYHRSGQYLPRTGLRPLVFGGALCKVASRATRRRAATSPTSPPIRGVANRTCCAQIYLQSLQQTVDARLRSL